MALHVVGEIEAVSGMLHTAHPERRDASDEPLDLGGGPLVVEGRVDHLVQSVDVLGMRGGYPLGRRPTRLGGVDVVCSRDPRGQVAVFAARVKVLGIGRLQLVEQPALHLACHAAG